MSGTGRRARERSKRALTASGESWTQTKPRRTVAAEPSFREKFRYRFDATMARGPSALVAWLGLFTLLIVVLVSVVVRATETNSGHTTIFGQLLSSFEHALDPGTVAGDTGSWGFLLTMLVVTLGGLFIVSALIG